MTIRAVNEGQTSDSSSRAYYNFVDAIRSPATRKVYEQSLRRYMNHLKLTTDRRRAIDG